MDAGDRLGIRVVPTQKNCYMLDKTSACLESAYLRGCYTSSIDPYPNTTKILVDVPQDDSAWIFILTWLRRCRQVHSGPHPATKQPEISVKQWCEQQKRTTFLEWSQIYCLAEALHMPRLEEHIRVAVELKAIATKRLPLRDAIDYLYEHSSRFCTLKYVFIDMYAIAAMKPRDVWRRERDLFPEGFVRDLCHYCQSEAYVERLGVLRECEARELGEDESGDDEE